MACTAKENGVIEIKSLQFDKRAWWYVTAVLAVKESVAAPAGKP